VGVAGRWVGRGGAGVALGSGLADGRAAAALAASAVVAALVGLAAGFRAVAARAGAGRSEVRSRHPRFSAKAPKD